MRYISARQMIFDAYHEQRGSVMAYAAKMVELGIQVQTTQRNNNDWRIVHGLEAGQVISAVENQPPHLAALARYCFGPFTRDELATDRETLVIALYRQMLADEVKLPGQGRGKSTAQQLETLRYLCMAALYHHSEVTWPYSRTGLHSPKAVAKWFKQILGVEIDVHYWTRNDRVSWGSVWQKLLDRLESWEYLSLSKLAMLIQREAS